MPMLGDTYIKGMKSLGYTRLRGSVIYINIYIYAYIYVNKLQMCFPFLSIYLFIHIYIHIPNRFFTKSGVTISGGDFCT